MPQPLGFVMNIVVSILAGYLIYLIMLWFGIPEMIDRIVGALVALSGFGYGWRYPWW